jgi:hypothetical protein
MSLMPVLGTAEIRKTRFAGQPGKKISKIPLNK